ncbi:protein QNR-71 isoform X2 [Lepisosteus oculatus]|uniref:protein QNR-71 isoform X2 n=1 Tax=Lepisosteus oculatus TaxID=7918 RepID=UPI0035F525B7
MTSPHHPNNTIIILTGDKEWRSGGQGHTQSVPVPTVCQDTGHSSRPTSSVPPGAGQDSSSHPCGLAPDPGVRDMVPLGSRTGSVQYPQLEGWSPDTNSWNEKLYPGFKQADLRRGRGRSIVAHLTSDSPALAGSGITFTTTLQFPKCQKEDANGDLVFDRRCRDANGLVRAGGYVYNWTSWIDDYGFGNCTDLSRCNLFPDGKPFPQRYDWRRRSFVYVWHTMGQYYQTCGGSVSSITLNTTNVTLGAGMMEVLVYHKRERRKYSPAATADGIYFVTDKIPLVVNISQKVDRNSSDNVFVKGSDIVFTVQLHDPSHYLRKSAVSYTWDFSDGNRLITHSPVATHAYSAAGNVTVKLTVKAAFPTPCPPPTPTPLGLTSTTPDPTTEVPTTSALTTEAPATTSTETTPFVTSVTPTTTTVASTTTAEPPTSPAESSSTAATEGTATPAFNSTSAQTAAPAVPWSAGPALQHGSQCLRYVYGSFEVELVIVDGVTAVESIQSHVIEQLSPAQVANITVDFVVKCIGSIPTIACTLISDGTCRTLKGVACEDIAPSESCQLTLQRTFSLAGTYCVNVTLAHPASIAQASTHVTVGKVSESSSAQAAETVLIAGTVLVVLFSAVAFVLYRHSREYKLVSKPGQSRAEGIVVSFRQVNSALLPGNEERNPLLQAKPNP